MPDSLEGTAVLKGDKDTFESLFDELVSAASVKHSLRLDRRPIRVGTKSGQMLWKLMRDQGREVEAWQGQVSQLFCLQMVTRVDTAPTARSVTVVEAITSFEFAHPKMQQFM